MESRGITPGLGLGIVEAKRPAWPLHTAVL